MHGGITHTSEGEPNGDSSEAGRVASLDANALDAPFRTCVAAGAGILAGLSVLVCTPSPFDPARFRHLWMTVRLLSGLGCRRVKTIVQTDAVDANDLQRLQHLVSSISDKTVIRSEPNLNDPALAAQENHSGGIPG
jgi:hypothetical protein